MNKKVVVFAPHPDDETLGCGGTIAKKLSEGYEVLIVFLTDGRNAFLKLFDIDSNPSPSELKEIRKDEVKRASSILSLSEDALLFLDFEDGMLGKNEVEVKKKVIEILGKTVPAEVYFTYEKDFHIDHRVANRIVRSSIKEIGLDALTYRYSITRKYARVSPLIDSFLNFFKHNMIRVDISNYLPLKEKALKEFKSQVTIISDRQQRPVLLNVERFLKNEEIFFVG